MLVAKAISFAFSPAGRIILIGLAFVAWTAYQRHDATADCEAEQLREELVEAQRQLGVSRQIAANARTRADTAEAELQTATEAQNELVKELETTGDACPIPDSIRKRLLDIR